MLVEQLRKKIEASFSDLTFDEKRHLYYWKGERVAKSVSGLVEEHEYPFDESKWLPICARKEGITEHELKHKWQTINIAACDLGHETHDFLEHYNGLQTPSTPQQEAGIKFFKDVLVDYHIVCRELRMYSRRFKYAGTADLLLMHKVTGKLVLADYKTNKDLFKAYDLLRPPFNYLEAHPFSKYQLQLSYYEIMLKEINCSISERLLVYLKADSTYKIFPTFDFTKQLSDHLLTRVAA